jgi:uncharacterized repeat protein (TIGR03803 family)
VFPTNGLRGSHRAVSIAFAAIAIIAVTSSRQACAATLKTLHAFCTRLNCTDGAYPQAGLVTDSSGNLYGTTYNGGAHGAGEVFEFAFTGTGYKFAVLYNFCAKFNCTDGSSPLGDLILDANGDLYGTTQIGGGHMAGTVFELVPNAGRTAWSLVTLRSFCVAAGCADGEQPKAGVTYQGAQAGKLYDGTSPLFGTTSGGGLADADGVAFQLTVVPGKTQRKETVLYDFCSLASCADGQAPYGLTIDGSGNLYGVTNFGGNSTNAGVAFTLTKAEGYAENVIYTFCQQSNCADGLSPVGTLARDKNNNLFGATLFGGTSDGGVIFEIALGVVSFETVLYEFCSQSSCTDGNQPETGVTVDSQGRIFGTTYFGGAHNDGTAFVLNGSTYRVLHSFCSRAACADGVHPWSRVLVDGSGNVFGTTNDQGANGQGGTVFELLR